MKIGSIGGSGLYQMEGIKDVREEFLNTPFGAPACTYILGELDGSDLGEPGRQ